MQFLINDEVMLNFGKNITYNVFDQNRFFAGLVFQVNKHDQLHAGYKFNRMTAEATYEICAASHIAPVCEAHIA